jgi:hypothetical protein
MVDEAILWIGVQRYPGREVAEIVATVRVVRFRKTQVMPAADDSAKHTTSLACVDGGSAEGVGYARPPRNPGPGQGEADGLTGHY